MKYDLLLKYPVIDQNTVRKLYGAKKEYAYLVLQRLEKKGIIKKVEKGKYTALDIYSTASNMAQPSYISFLTASMLKGATEQIINTVQIASNYNKEIDYENYTLEFIKVKYMFGYQKEKHIFIADNEKLLLDMLYYRNHAGNFSEIIKVTETLDFKKEKIIHYLKKFNNNSLIKRSGYLLEKYKGMDINDSFEIDRNYVQLDLLSNGKKVDSKWRVKYD